MGLPLEEIRDASEEALRKIDNDPDRIGELSDDDLTAVALQMKTLHPMVEAALVSLCGNVESANGVLARVYRYSQGKLVKLVRGAHVAMKTHGNPSTGQLAALLIDTKTAVGAITTEQERRNATRAGRMN